MDMLDYQLQRVIFQGQEQQDKTSYDNEDENFLAHLDKSLDSFGSNVKSVIYFKFEEDHGLKREDIPRKPDLFIETVERMFGPGATVVKSHIAREMREVIAPKEGKGGQPDGTA